jgi:hypothetical protein
VSGKRPREQDAGLSLPLGDPVEEALGVAVEIAQLIGLQAVCDHAVEKMPGQMIGGLAAERNVRP